MSLEVIRGRVTAVTPAQNARGRRSSGLWDITVNAPGGEVRTLESVELFGQLKEQLLVGAWVVLVHHWDQRGRGRLVAGHVAGQTEVHRFPAELLGGWGVGISALLIALGLVSAGWPGALLAASVALLVGMPLLMLARRETQVKFDVYRVLNQEGLLGLESEARHANGTAPEDERQGHEAPAVPADPFRQRRRDGRLAEQMQPFDELDALVDFSALARSVEKACSAVNPSEGEDQPQWTERMVRILFLQALYGHLNDEQMEGLLLDRRTFQRFLGAEDLHELPDASTIGDFRQRLAEVGHGTQEILGAVEDQLARAGYTVRGGRIVDAAVIERASQGCHEDERKRVPRGERELELGPHSAAPV